MRHRTQELGTKSQEPRIKNHEPRAKMGYFMLVGVMVVSVLGGYAQGAKKSLGPGAAAVLEARRDTFDLKDAGFVFYVGYTETYRGNDAVGNELMEYALSLKDSVTADDYQELSVQHTKNGNYALARAALDKAVALDAQQYGYYGWVLLYYYHDYTKALECLEKFDALTPHFSDAPAGEDIHFQKGQCYMQLGRLDEAVAEFDTYIRETTRSHGEEWVDAYTFIYKGRCLHRQGKLTEAAACYDKAIQYYKYCTEGYYYKALALAPNGEPQEVCALLQKALELAQQRYLYRDVYVEFFESVYMQDIEAALRQYCPEGK